MDKTDFFSLSPAKIVSIYFLLGALWIFFSDNALSFLAEDVETLTYLQNVKGWFYVLVTSILLYALISYYSSRQERNLEEVETLRQIDRGIITETELPSLLNVIMEKVRELTPAEVTFLGFLEGNGIRYKSFPQGKGAILESKKDPGWQAIEKRAPFIVNNIESEPPFHAKDDFSRAYSSLVAVPFFSGQKPWGVLYVASRDKNSFSQREVKTLESIAGQIPVALEHFRLKEDLQKSNQELRRAHQELEALNILKNNIIGNVSHELLTPLTVIYGLVELLKEEEDPKEREDIIKRIEKTLKREENVVDDLVSLSQIFSQKFKLHYTQEEVSTLIESAVSSIEEQAREKSITLSTSVGENLSIDCDREKMLHAISELLENAVKFSPEGSEIKVSARREDGELLFAVEDEGVGIEEDRLEEVFRPLTQLDSSTSRRHGGTGTGLAVAKYIIDLHSGKIWVESGGKGKGSTFYFTLPS